MINILPSPVVFFFCVVCGGFYSSGYIYRLWCCLHVLLTSPGGLQRTAAWGSTPRRRHTDPNSFPGGKRGSRGRLHSRCPGLENAHVLLADFGARPKQSVQTARKSPEARVRIQGSDLSTRELHCPDTPTTPQGAAPKGRGAGGSWCPLAASEGHGVFPLAPTRRTPRSSPVSPSDTGARAGRPVGCI